MTENEIALFSGEIYGKISFDAAGVLDIWFQFTTKITIFSSNKSIVEPKILFYTNFVRTSY